MFPDDDVAALYDQRRDDIEWVEATAPGQRPRGPATLPAEAPA